MHSPHNVPQAFFRWLFPSCLPWVVCLPCLQEQCSTLLALSQPCLQTFKIPGFKPHWLEELMKFSLSHFQAIGFGKMISLCISLCAFLSHPSLWPPLLPLYSICDPCLSLHFVPSLMWLLLFLLLWSLFCQTSGWFWRYLGWFDNYLVVFVRLNEARVLLLYHHSPFLPLGVLLSISEYHPYLQCYK